MRLILSLRCFKPVGDVKSCMLNPINFTRIIIVIKLDTFKINVLREKKKENKDKKVK